MRTYIINWFGPYELNELVNLGSFGNGIYLISGRTPYERVSSIQYCGITEDTFYNRIKTHHKKDYITKDRKFWLGEFEYPTKINRNVLETAEKIIVYFWLPKLNEKKKVSPPAPTTILNFWFKKDGNLRLNQIEIYRDLWDVISWDGKWWRTGNLKVWQEQF